ncbi:hypothetical protein PF005_g22455 [Phytophthora fragariae]|uniref:Uncharacterized protein n=2 Tax=Phytophthora fragariae TaxID=53985 RepID=A0A6A3RYG7_9STRA|nr:hypothetical protein PF003_g24866 [Phytophthora fragariae]KAE8926573.1 hypothetical protein PF009_g23241 [Phytophthora fragariae]KAE9081921.1 hypothetical protein PF007_g22479 [Phytophthora fragariae]KAE9105721.1 hypothetical protein PF006_g21546 [Phytophthora fragariae]KAE9182507.1 hypothetical protein PF005_g22455 [Phytophthora fragariae]
MSTTKSRVHPEGKGAWGKRARNSSRDSTAQTRESDIIMVHSKAKRKFSPWHVFSLLRRLASIAAAIQVLNQDVLGGDTTPRHYALFLESKTKVSTSNCSSVPLFDPAIYNYEFLSSGYVGLVANTKYNISVLDELELVVTIVDCTFRQIKVGDPSALRVYNLVRSVRDPSHVQLLTMSMSVQDYEIQDHSKQGPALLGMLTLVESMQDDNVEQFYMVAPTYPYQRAPDFEMYEFVGISDGSFLALRSIPRDPLMEPVKNLITARKRGFYDGESQSNVRVMYSVLDKLNATNALTRWEWIGEAVTVDSWAWVHWIHLYFAVQTIYSLIVLFLVMYHKFRSGKIWIGDPFASVSTASIVLRGILVLMSWVIDNFWSINEYAMSRAAMITGSQTVRIHKEVMHADIMVVFLSLTGILSAIFRERIDPAIVLFLFELIHKYRLPLVRSSSAVLNEVVKYSDAQYYVGIAKVKPIIAAMSPLRFWTSFQFPSKSATFLVASFFPMTYLLVSVSCLAILRKIYHYRYPEQTRPRLSHSTDTSGNEKAAMTLRGIVTNFEIATGAELQTRFGLISDYNNYVYFKGMKFASADGVYCSGYVIVNGKFLVRSQDLVAIVMMKLFHARFTNVYTYEVEGNTVKETARLVHTTTFLWSDLWRLNVTVLL